MLPHVIRFNAQTCESLYARLIEPSDGLSAADALAECVQDLNRLAGLPQSLRECHVDEHRIDELATQASKQWTAQFNPRPLSETDFAHLYRQALGNG